MKTVRKVIAIKNTAIVTIAFVTLNLANAHDPSMHKESSEKPKCEMMEGMDHTKMPKDDLVMQAMMKKCMSKHSEEGEHHSSDDTSKSKLENKTCSKEHADMGHCKMVEEEHSEAAIGESEQEPGYHEH